MSRSEISQVPIMREFLDVFLEELHGMPLEKEIGFSIDLDPRTIPISCTPIEWL